MKTLYLVLKGLAMLVAVPLYVMLRIAGYLIFGIVVCGGMIVGAYIMFYAICCFAGLMDLLINGSTDFPFPHLTLSHPVLYGALATIILLIGGFIICFGALRLGEGRA